MVSDVRRRIEGQTKLRKNVGIKSDPSPIPINSNVYIPTREGKGDVTVEPVESSADVRSITDLDYFKDKEFATLRIPKYYLGFDSESGSILGNNSLVKMDSRYAHTVQRIQQVLINGITELCNNYLRYRGKISSVNNFKIRMRPLDTPDVLNRIEELQSNLQVIDSAKNSLYESFPKLIDQAKLLHTLLNLTGIPAADIASEEFLKILEEFENGTYKQSNHNLDDEGGM